MDGLRIRPISTGLAASGTAFEAGDDLGAAFGAVGEGERPSVFLAQKVRYVETKPKVPFVLVLAVERLAPLLQGFG